MWSEGTHAGRDITVLLPFCSTKNEKKKKSVFDRNIVQSYMYMTSINAMHQQRTTHMCQTKSIAPILETNLKQTVRPKTHSDLTIQ